jgi:hypothetical protein
VRQKLYRRLEDLDKINAAAAAERERMRPCDNRVLDELIAKAEAWHAVPENQAWLAAQPPEYFTTSMREFKAQLEDLASGRSRAVQGQGF